MGQKKNNPYKYIAFISQVGISVIVPIGMMMFFGKLIDYYFHTGTWIVIVFTVLGVLAGFRNLYVIPMRLSEKAIKEREKQKKEEESDQSEEE
ncbi:MAG: synthase protein [Eubacteriaceae bacterium]|jgi:F0F1-type ATP synthase assembly protein I|nr:synthase protein [Eubacteriaceae bacterium]